MNKYYNHFFFEGPAGTISSMYDWIKANDPKSSDYWLDELVKTRGVDTSDFYVKCATIWKYEVDQGVLKVLVDSRGGGALEYMWAIEEQFPGVKLWYEYYSAEAGVVHTNDKACKFHDYNYAVVLTTDVNEESYWSEAWVFSPEQEGKIFKTLKEVAQYASQVLNRDVPEDWEMILNELKAAGLLVDSICILDQDEE